MEKQFFFQEAPQTLNGGREGGFFHPGSNSHNLFPAETLKPVSVALGGTLLQQQGPGATGRDSWEIAGSR